MQLLRKYTLLHAGAATRRYTPEKLLLSSLLSLAGAINNFFMVFIVNTLREYKQPILKRLAYHLPRWVVVKLLDALVFSSIRYCLPLWGSMRLSNRESPTQLSKSIQVQIYFALRCVLGLSLEDQVSVKRLNEMTNSLTLNQLVIQATNRLTTNILNGDCPRGVRRAI
jgi:hypothetical protein